MKTAEKELLLEVGDGDIKMLREALVCVYRNESSPLRIMAAVRFGGRHVWAAIVQEWDRVAKDYAGKGRLTMMAIYSDGSGNITVDDGK